MYEAAYIAGLIMSTATHPVTLAVAAVLVVALRRWWAIPLAGAVTPVVIEFGVRRPNLERLGLTEGSNPLPTMTDIVAGCLAASVVFGMFAVVRRSGA